jgi:hypothetical protein
MAHPPSRHWKRFPNKRGQDQPIDTAFKNINFRELCKVASALRGNELCDVDKTKYEFGGVNIVFELSFLNHETVWIARIRFPDIRYAGDGVDYTLESEVTTMRFLREKTNLPVPAVYGYDSQFDNEVGLPYILLEAMPGKRLRGPGRADFIPDQHKRKVYGQIADILVELYNHPFDTIGMLYPMATSDGGKRVCVGPIYDQHHRLKPYGPFSTSLEFYRTRSELLNEHRRKSNTSAASMQIIAHEDEPDAIRHLVDPNRNRGPFYLAHPDFQVSNFLFDDDFNITALLDWSGCQTIPLESFANAPGKLIPDADQFLDGWAAMGLLTLQIRLQWGERRQLFLEILEAREIARSKNAATAPTSPIVRMMESPCSYFAMCLDCDGILGMSRPLPKEQFEKFCGRKSVEELEQ